VDAAFCQCSESCVTCLTVAGALAAFTSCVGRRLAFMSRVRLQMRLKFSTASESIDAGLWQSLFFITRSEESRAC